MDGWIDGYKGIFNLGVAWWWELIMHRSNVKIQQEQQKIK